MPMQTHSGTTLSTRHERIVHGGRGDYVEMSEDSVVRENLAIPKRMEWRLSEPWASRVFYIEHRSADKANVKVYEQLKTVDYADYRIGFWYVAVGDVEVTP